VNGRFELANALASRENFEGLANQPNIGQRLDKKINNRAGRT